MRFPRLQAGLAARVDEFRRGAEQGDLRVVGIVEQRVAVRIEGRAVVEHDRRFGGQRADNPVPHHPAAGGEPEDPVSRLHVGVQAMLLGVGQNGRADAVHDAFRRAGRAGGVEDIERIVESDAGELDLVRARAAPCIRRAAWRAERRKCPATARHRVRSAPAPATACRRRCRAACRGRAGPCRCNGRRRRRSGPWAQPGRTGRARPARRNPARPR